MKDRTNDIEVSGVRVKMNDLPLVQRAMRDFPSIRFLCDPWRSKGTSYYDISYGGKGDDIREFETVIKDFYYEDPKVEKKPFFQRIFGSKE